MPETHQNPNHTRSLPNYLGQNIHLKARPTTPTLKSARSLSNTPPQKRLVRSPGQTLQQCERLGLALGDVIAERGCRLAPLMAAESFVIAAWTRPTVLAPNQVKRDRKRLRRRLLVAKVLGGDAALVERAPSRRNNETSEPSQQAITPAPPGKQNTAAGSRKLSSGFLRTVQLSRSASSIAPWVKPGERARIRRPCANGQTASDPDASRRRSVRCSPRGHSRPRSISRSGQGRCSPTGAAV